jgi:hypothetical protein
MTHEAESLIDAEQRAVEEITPQIRGNLTLCLATFDLIGMALTVIPPRPVRELTQAFKVTSDLLIRLANDLRGVGLLAERGYALQAASLGASIYEVAYTVAFIGADEGLAQEWIRHEDPTRPFRGVWDLTVGGLRSLGLDNEMRRRAQYRVYRQLCLAKHANPILEMIHGFRLEHGDVVGGTGPDSSEAAIRAARFALEHSVGLAGVALKVFLINHVRSEEASGPILERLGHVEARRRELRKEAIARWGTENPFPDRW